MAIFNDYEMKYKTHDTHKKIPAELPKEVGDELDRQAIAIYKIMGCAGFSRVDFFVTDDMEIIFNEINTVPGFTRGASIRLCSRPPAWSMSSWLQNFWRAQGVKL